MRNLVTSLVLVATFGLSVGASLASELAVHKYAVEELKRVCEKTGGSFSRVMDSWAIMTPVVLLAAPVIRYTVDFVTSVKSA